MDKSIPRYSCDLLDGRIILSSKSDGVPRWTRWGRWYSGQYISGYGNKTVKYEEITSNDIQNSHRRCLCACGCYSFGDAFELWAGLEIQEAKEEEERTPPPPKTGVAKTPTKPNQKLESTSVLEKLPDPISKDAKTTILDKLTQLQQSQPEKLKGVVESFRKKFGIKDTKIVKHITTAEQGEFLALEISKIDESLWHQMKLLLMREKKS